MNKYMLLNHLAVICTLGLTHLGQAQAGESGTSTHTYHVTKGKADFTAIGTPGFLRINGEGAKLRGQITMKDAGSKQIISAHFEVSPKEYITGLDIRDQHMKEKYLEVGRYPTISFDAKDVAIDNDDLDDADLTGILSLHGVRKPTEIDLSLKRQGSSLKGKAEFSITLSDFKIDIPSFTGITVADKVTIAVNFEAKGP